MDIHTLLTFADLTALVKPRMLHTTVEDATEAAGTDERLRTRRPFDGVNEDNTITLEMLKLEHAAVTELLLREKKRRPVMETILKVAPAGSANDTVNVTFKLEFKGGAWGACWLRISVSFKARSYTARNFMRPPPKFGSKLGAPNQWLFPM